MVGVALQVQFDGVKAINLALKGAALVKPYDLIENVASVVESQTRRRLEEEKQAPDGKPWVQWSKPYAKTRQSGQRLLDSDGDLIDSIESFVRGNQAMIGSNLVYAAIHQAGGEDVGMPIPARPYLGVSSDNQKELETIIQDWLGGLL